MLSIVFLAVQVTCGLNPRKLHLEKLTEAFDAEYYDYYGTSVDSFTDVDIEQNNGKLMVTPKLSNTRYCWSCSTGDISNCRERGYLQKCERGQVCQLSVNRHRSTPKDPFLITSINMGCATEHECRQKMTENFARGGDKCEPSRQRQSTCTQCCSATNCFTSQGYVDAHHRLFTPSQWNGPFWTRDLNLL